MYYNKRQQSGFTLVEIAIVMVVIGLLLGGVLKGQELIENSRTKSIVNDMNGVAAAFNGYQDRFRAIPGDEALATLQARGWNVTVGGNANGVLNITTGQVFNPAGEQIPFWQAVRAANFATGAPNAVGQAALPRAGHGGLVAVGNAVYGMSRPATCISNLSTKQASAVDTAIDGTLPQNNVGNNLGDVRGANGAANLAPAAALPADIAYNETTITNTWTLCRQM